MGWSILVLTHLTFSSFLTKFQLFDETFIKTRRFKLFMTFKENFKYRGRKSIIIFDKLILILFSITNNPNTLI